MSINVRLKHKRDTAANWTSKNPVLLDGEIVLVDDNGTLRIKMGDGLTTFKLLPYYDAPMTAHIANTSNPHKVTKTQVGLGNVDNTADADKSVNYATSAGHAITADGLTGVTATTAELNVLDGITASTAELNLLDGVTATTAEINYLDGVTSAIQSQINAKAALASPTLTGTPKAPTAAAGTNTTQIATTAFVTTAISNKTSVSGNAGTATKLANARTITLSGDVSGSVSFDGSDNVTITTTVADDSHNHTIANVDNLQANLDAKASLASPAFTGTPTAPTATAGTNTTQVATTAFVTTAVANKTSVATATKATQDGSGNVITSTYATKTELTNGLAGKANTSTTLAGYGITNAYTKTEVDNKFGAIVEKITFTTSDWGTITNGNYPLTIAKNKACLGVYMVDGSNYNKVEVGITTSGNNNIIYSPNKFSGYALFV